MKTDARSLGQLLDDLAHGHDTAAAGIAAATSAALAAAVTAMAARRSRPRWVDAGGAVAQAEALRARLTALASTDAEAYTRAHALLAQTGHDRDQRGAPGAPTPAGRSAVADRERELATALRDAALPPLAIAEAAAEVAELALLVAAEGSADHRADAAGALLLAAGAARAGAQLVTVNLGVAADDELAVRARAAVAAADAACDRLRTPSKAAS